MELVNARKSWSLLIYLAWLTFGLACADGRVFLLDLRHSSDITFEVASSKCEAEGAQVASAVDLRHAVVECLFTACARGWLSGPSIGTTVCRSVAGNLRAVDTQVENVTQTHEKLAVFCIKDTGAPCGFPPSFPNSHLQRHAGLGLGDELVYACNPGYILPSGERGFSLLCDSCGEWYGLVHLCVKDISEGHVDYEKELADNHHLYDGMKEVHGVSLIPWTTSHGEEEESTPEPEQLEHMEEASQTDNASVKTLTETPVSQLSQKHIFWFPSEAFQEEDNPLITTVMPSKRPTKDQVKGFDSWPGPQITLEHNADEYTTQASTVVSPVEAWLNGHPVPKVEEKAVNGSRKDVASMQGIDTNSMSNYSKVEEFGSVIHHSKETGVGGIVHIHQEKAMANVPKPSDELVERVTDQEEGTNTKVKGYEDRFHSQNVDYHEVTNTPPENIFVKATSPSEEKYFVTEKVQGEAKRPLDVEHKKGDKTLKELEFHGVTDRPNYIDLNLTALAGLTQVTPDAGDKSLVNIPISYTTDSAPETVNANLEMGLATPSGLAHDTTPASVVHVISNVTAITISIPWETEDYGHFTDKTPIGHDDVSLRTHENRSAMEGDTDRSLDQHMKHEDETCSVDPCQIASHGTMIAAIIVAIVAAIVGLALGVWCYKRRQQKNSHYQLNGTNRQTQCIELHQTV